MIAALPFYEMRMVDDGIRVILGEFLAVVPTFGIPVDPWATLVMLGILIGMEVARARGIAMGFEPRDVVDGVLFTVLVGFLFAHWFTVLFYFPERLSEDGILSLLKVWEGFSSTGGFIGALIALPVFYTWIRPRDVMRFVDVFFYGFPIGWLLGRAGCAVVHDHIGAPTDFPLAIAFPPTHYAAGVRHELGLYEMVLMIPIVVAFWWLGKKDRPPGFFMGLFIAMYSPIRFGLDFLRSADLATSDARYLGLTPAQYGMIGFFLLGVGILVWSQRRAKDFKPWPLDGSPDQAAQVAGEAAA